MKKNEVTIQVLEDDEVLGQLFLYILRKEGYKVNLSDNLNVDQMEEFPQIFIIDVLLGPINGKDICRAIKNRPETGNIPVIMMSAMADEKQKCLEAGAIGFINKPFELSHIYNTIEMVLKNNAAAVA